MPTGLLALRPGENETERAASNEAEKLELAQEEQKANGDKSAKSKDAEKKEEKKEEKKDDWPPEKVESQDELISEEKVKGLEEDAGIAA